MNNKRKKKKKRKEIEIGIPESFTQIYGHD
jgi:hypothetical protein